MDAIVEAMRPSGLDCVCRGDLVQSDPKEHAMPTSRVQLALNVTDVESATRFYVQLFGVEPHKQRPGYANFSIAEPPLKLVLIENPGAASALNHLGVELADADQVAAATGRFSDLGLPTRESEQERCCHAVQDKVYVTAPEVPLGQWEFYTILDDNPDASVADAADTCCPTSPSGDGPC
jgi:catechol 2,3-dioxygenase-like lactoylglutathione lyase family enzyme